MDFNCCLNCKPYFAVFLIKYLDTVLIDLSVCTRVLLTNQVLHSTWYSLKSTRPLVLHTDQLLSSEYYWPTKYSAVLDTHWKVPDHWFYIRFTRFRKFSSPLIWPGKTCFALLYKGVEEVFAWMCWVSWEKWLGYDNNHRFPPLDLLCPWYIRYGEKSCGASNSY